MHVPDALVRAAEKVKNGLGQLAKLASVFSKRSSAGVEQKQAQNHSIFGQSSVESGKPKDVSVSGTEQSKSDQSQDTGGPTTPAQ